MPENILSRSWTNLIRGTESLARLIFLVGGAISVGGCHDSHCDGCFETSFERSLTVTDVSDRSISITWHASGNPTDRVLYCVYYSDFGPLRSLEDIRLAGTLWGQCNTGPLAATVLGLKKDSRYYFNVVAIDSLGDQSVYSGSSADTLRLLPVSFSDVELPNSYGFTPGVADLDGDGWVETLGTRGDRKGNLIAIDPGSTGLASLFSPDRENRDVRLVDLNGDGRIDIVANTYSSVDKVDSIRSFVL